MIEGGAGTPVAEPDIQSALARLVETSADAVLVHRDLKPLYANCAVARLLGFGSAAALKARGTLVGIFDDRHELGETGHDAVAAGTKAAATLCMRATRPDGNTLPVELLVQSVEWIDGPATKLTVRDLTERRQQEERMGRVYRDLIDAARSRAMREVANSLRHGLNQPRGAMLNWLNLARRLMRQGRRPEEVLAAVDRLTREAERAYQVLAGVETLFASGRESMAIEDLNGVLAQVAEIAAVDAAAKDVRLFMDFHPRTPVVRMNREQIQQVVLGLIHAAIDAFDDEADRRVLLRTQALEHGLIRVLVIDTLAPDVSAARIQRLTRGIGCSLAETIVHAHGGRMDFETRTDGVAIGFTLPVDAGRPRDA